MDDFSIKFCSLENSHQADFITEGMLVSDNLNEIPFPFHPSRTDCLAFCICVKGSAVIEINLIQYKLVPDTICVIMPDQLLRVVEVSDDIAVRFFAFSPEFAQTNQLSTRTDFSIYLYVKDHPVIALLEHESKILLEYYHLFQSKRYITDKTTRQLVVHQLFVAMICESTAFFRNRNITGNQKKSHKEVVFEKFINLVFEHFRLERGLEFYAEKLCLTTKYLSTLSKSVSGKTASEWIEDVVILEAKALLKTPEMNVQMVSDRLNFPDQSFFGKYFKRITGMTPSEYKSL